MLRLDMHMIAGVLQYVAVASFAEAWIENILSLLLWIFREKSPPSRRRGLKTLCTAIVYIQSPSPPSRRRGLKKYLCDFSQFLNGRLLRGGVD